MDQIDRWTAGTLSKGMRSLCVLRLFGASSKVSRQIGVPLCPRALREFGLDAQRSGGTLGMFQAGLYANNSPHGPAGSPRLEQREPAGQQWQLILPRSLVARPAVAVVP